MDVDAGSRPRDQDAPGRICRATPLRLGDTIPVNEARHRCQRSRRRVDEPMDSLRSGDTARSGSSRDRTVVSSRCRLCRLCKRRTYARYKRDRRQSPRNQRRRRTDRKPCHRISALRRGIQRCTESRNGRLGTRRRWSSRRRRHTRRSGGAQDRNAEIRAPYNGRQSRTPRTGPRCNAVRIGHSRDPACRSRARRSGCHRDTRQSRGRSRPRRRRDRTPALARGRRSR
jgi:hypothetical protein